MHYKIKDFYYNSKQHLIKFLKYNVKVLYTSIIIIALIELVKYI